ncbi:chorismate synthase [Sporolactobacillus sp. CQH2019]|uniref:chorismate synthase n=1 Tax=Sporolactobacillus sp. CQH2019 TaxID=3023512 RepID=UPI002368EEB1|nr:chorismate synthase [Sporolactobacillus sp. CQH2019]MDD9148660.1 chorismate synthase [Sporolactobacillus sp. CQH2019]
MRFLTAGESHGPQLTAIIEGLPSEVDIDISEIDRELKRRQGGYGRGRRMTIESDQVQILSGVRHGKTTGAPMALVIENRDWTHWKDIMGVQVPDDPERIKKQVTRPRPGHADLNGGIKYNHRDMRNVLERSSARETAIRVAIGAVAKQFLKPFGIDIAGRVTEIGGVADGTPLPDTIEEMKKASENSPVRCLDPEAARKMIEAIDRAKENGDSLGGIVEVVATGAPIGLGSHVHYDRKLDARIAGAVLSINAFKGVEFGIGFDMAHRPGSQVQDEILWSEEQGYTRRTNRLGGFEGGMTNGMPIIVRGVMKPIPTLYKPLQSIDINTKEPFSASIERSDNCAVPAASVVCEAVVAWELAKAVSEKFGGDCLTDMTAAWAVYQKRVRSF